MNRVFKTMMPLGFFVLSAISYQATAQTDQKLTEKTVKQKAIKKHIYYIASDELMGRDLPSAGLEKAGDYLAKELKSYGVKPAPGHDTYMQPMPMKLIMPPASGSLTFAGKTFQLPDQLIMLEGKDATVEGEVVYVKFGQEPDFADLDVKGKIVIAQAGNGISDEPRSFFGAAKVKRELAAQKGAIALIELYNSPKLPWNILKSYLHKKQVLTNDGTEEQPNDMPHIWLEDLKNETVLLAKGTGGKATLTLSGIVRKNFDTYNIVGVIEGTDPTLKNEYVMYSAHYDHIGVGAPNAEGDSIFNGARDNAVGAVTVLSAAQNLAKYPTKRSALFVLFTGEEKGLLGSAYYAEHPWVPLNQVVYCFNSDNGGYNDTSKATIIGLARTTAQDMIKKACNAFGLEAIDDPAPEQGLFDRSDNVNFAKKGIPAPTFSMGMTAFDAEILKYYHQTSDNPDNLDYDYLLKFFQAYVYASRLIGNSEKDLFWIEGDKYFEAGQKLYNR